MGKFKYLFFLLLGVLFFISPQKAQAADSDVVINEVMANPFGDDPDFEWIELYNNSSELVGLSGWKINSFTIPSGVEIPAKSYLIIARELVDSNADSESFESYWGNKSGVWGDDSSENYLAIDSSMSLTNSNGNLLLNNQKIGNEKYETSYNWTSSREGYSWEKIDSTIVNFAETSEDKNWYEGLEPDGTPGEKNSVSQIIPPQKPQILPISITAGDKIIFDFTREEDVNYKILISKSLENAELFQPFSSDDVEYLESGSYYWQVEATNEPYTVKSDISTLQISEPVYSDNIIVNELYPDPASGEEWIEFYNNSAETVNLKNWILEDEGLNRHSIATDLIIGPFEYAIIFYSNSKITLNNDGDLINLFDPNGKPVSSTWRYLDDGNKSWSYARAPDSRWQWTTQITPGGPNVIISPVVNADSEELKIPVNDEPIEINTGDTENYRDYLVTVSGEITRTSGNTFYLDDGSGEIKIYIQEKTDIDKPPMHQGDIFEITGIVNIYRNTWRLLPQKQDDIKLIQTKDMEKSSTTAKTSTAKKSSSSTKSTSSNTNARAPTAIKQVKAAESTENDTPGVSTEKGSSFWINFIKMLVGLAIILLIIFVLKMRSIKKEKPLGADFGDDLT